MWVNVQRTILPLLLVIAGIGSAIYGAKCRVIPVVQENEEEITLPGPFPFLPGLPGPEGQPFPDAGTMPPGPPFAEGQPPGDEPPAGMPPPLWQPPGMSTKVLKKVILTTDELEPTIIREVSVGGLTLADSGEIKRTYSGDQGPALCPT